MSDRFTTGALKRPIRVILIGTLAVAFGLGLAPLGVAATASADAPTGTISGIITDSNEVFGIQNINVLVQNLATGTFNDGGVVDSKQTDANGFYSMAGIPVGTYRVSLFDTKNDPVYLDSTIDNVVVNANAETAVNASMTTGGVVTGRVVYSNGTGADGVVITSETEEGGITTTAPDGTFTLSGLTDGPHEIYINTELLYRGIGDGHQGLTYNVTPGFGPAHVKVPLVPTDSAAVAIPPVTIDAASDISGIVLGGTGLPLAHVDVDAETLDADGTVGQLTADAGNTVETSSTGAFTIPNLPTGKVYLHFTPEYGSPAAAAYGSQYLGGSTDVNLSTPVAITSEGSTVFREVRLTSNGAITGKITSKANGAALAHVRVDVAPLVAGSSTTVDTVKAYEEGIGGTAVTGSTGLFTIHGLPAGTYQVTYNSESSGAALASSDTSTTTLYVPANTTVSHSVALAPRTRVTGTVRDAAHPLAGIQVDAFVYNTISHTVGADPISTGRDTTSTLSNGTYTLYLDPTHTYVIRFTDPTGAHGVSYLGGTSDPADASTTKLLVGTAALASKNITLAMPGGQVTGTVLDSDGNPANSAGTAVLNRLTGPEGTVTGDLIDESTIGGFPITGLADGSYQLVVSPETEGENYIIAPTTVDFTLDGGVLSEINGVPATGDDLGTIQLAAPTYVPDAQYTVGGNLPSISSTTNLNIGDVLTADDGDWSPAPPQFFHQWYRDGRPILGAAGTSYTITPGDAGKQLSVGLYFSDPNSEGGDNQPDAMTAQTDAVLDGQIAPPSVSPSVSGSEKVGQVLTGSKGLWSTPLLNFGYQWIRTVGSATTVVSTATTYKPVAADTAAGATLEFSVTASRLGYESDVVTSTPATIALASAPKLTVSPKVTHTAATNSYAVSSGTWSPSGTTHTFQWLIQNPADGAIALGPTTSSYANAPAHYRIQVIITAARAGYATSAVTVTAQTGDPVQVTSGTPNIIGTNAYGFPLTADVTGLTTLPGGASYLYQWYRGTAKITGAIKAIYTPTTTDVNKSLSVSVTPVLSGYANGTAVVSSPVIEQAAGSFQSTGGTAITGTQSVGRTLTAIQGTWTPAPTTVLYQWYRISPALVTTKITGATKPTYPLGTADLGAFIQVHITVERAGYVSTFVNITTSAISTLSIQNVTAPSIAVAAHVGTALTTTAGTWDVPSTTYTYQWFDNAVPIVGATGTTFVPAESELGDDINVAVAAHRVGFGSSNPAASLAVTVGLGTAAKATAGPRLSVAGKTVTSLKRGTTVATTVGTWSTSGLVFSYQWQVNRNDGNGYVDLATTDSGSSTLLLNSGGDPSDFALLYSYRVVVTAERSGYLPSAPITSGALTIKS
jgi:hypothetical protein